MRRAISGAGPKSASEPATSRKASSIETCSTAGVKRRRTVITSRLTRWYLAPSTGRKMPFGQSCSAVAQRHGRMHAELAGLVAAGADDAARVLVRARVAADDHRLAAQLRAVALLHGREERVEIDVDDVEAGMAAGGGRHGRMMAPRARGRVAAGVRAECSGRLPAALA